MVHTSEEIIKAVQVIKDECMNCSVKHIGCKTCPISTPSGNCMLNDSTPYTWDINSGDDWKAFL